MKLTVAKTTGIGGVTWDVEIDGAPVASRTSSSIAINHALYEPVIAKIFSCKIDSFLDSGTPVVSLGRAGLKVRLGDLPDFCTPENVLAWFQESIRICRQAIEQYSLTESAEGEI